IERFAEIGLRSGAEAISTLAKIDLIYVELEDLILGEAVLDLEREQGFVKLAGERLLRGQEEVARDLHGDGARALAPASGNQVRIRGTQYSEVIDSGVFVEALVFGRDDRVLQ